MSLYDAFKLVLRDINVVLNGKRPVGNERANYLHFIHSIVRRKNWQLKEWALSNEGAKAVLEGINEVWDKATNEYGFGLSCKEKVKGSGVYLLKTWDAENGEENFIESIIPTTFSNLVLLY